MAAALFKDANLVLRDGSTVPASEALQGKVTGIYFSAHWCGPCRRFTPLLAQRYQDITAEGHSFEIVFVSSDRDESSCIEYFQTMPWKLLDFNQRDVKISLSKLFSVVGIPTLVLIDEEGEILTKDGRGAIMLPFEKLRTYEADIAEEQRKWASEQRKWTELMETLPDSISHLCHEHELVKTRGRSYGCDVCQESGSGCSYYCKQCDFDAHPKCVFPDI
jgi:nucleoredoxin